MTDDLRMVYLVGRCGCLGWVKVGATGDLIRRLRSLRESRTNCPPAARGRSVHLLAAWPEGIAGPTEADLLARFADHRWRAPSGRLSEYLNAHDPDVRAWLAHVAPAWPHLVTCDPDSLRPILVDRADRTPAR